MPEAARDLAVLCADAIGGAAHANGKRGHAEMLGIVGKVCAAEGEELFVCQLERLDVSAAETFTELLGLEHVVARSDRSVGCKNALFATGRGRIGEIVIGICFEMLLSQFECQKCRVAFVQMKYG